MDNKAEPIYQLQNPKPAQEELKMLKYVSFELTDMLLSSVTILVACFSGLEHFTYTPTSWNK